MSEKQEQLTVDQARAMLRRLRNRSERVVFIQGLEFAMKIMRGAVYDMQAELLLTPEDEEDL